MLSLVFKKSQLNTIRQCEFLAVSLAFYVYVSVW